MSKVFRSDVKIWATAYIKAETEEEALIKLRELRNCGLEIPDTDWANANDELEVHISGRAYNDPDLPNLSLSPMMTIDGEAIDSMSADELELAEELG